MGKQELTEAQLQQRRKAHEVHGAYSYKEQGEAALDAPRRSMLADLKEQVRTRPELLEVLRDQVVDSIMVTRILKSHVVEQVQRGVPIENVPAMKALASYQNTALRGIALLLTELPKDDGVIDITDLKRQYAEVTHEQDS